MVAKKRKKNCQLKLFRNFCIPITSKTHLIKSLNSLDSSRPYGKLSENAKIREL